MHEMPSPSLPSTPDDHQHWTSTTASCVTVAGRRLLTLPFRAPVGASRGRRYLVRFDHELQPQQRVVFSLAGVAALAAPAGLEPGTNIQVWLRALAVRRDRRLPTDLTKLLSAEGLQAEAVPNAELAQLIAMINESATPEIRSARLLAAMNVIRHGSNHA